MDCPLFSIIIPHKDIPDLLMRCLRSIPVSGDIQVIVVDDNRMLSQDRNYFVIISLDYLRFILLFGLQYILLVLVWALNLKQSSIYILYGYG